MARRVVPISLKVNILILISLTVGIGAIAVYLGFSLTRTIEDTTLTSLDRESDIVFEAIEQLMVPGEAPLVVNLFEGIGEVDARFSIYLYRSDGTPAFSDNETIRDVNQRIGGSFFVERAPGESDSMAPAIDVPSEFARATALPARSVSFEQVEGEATVIRFFKPLINLPKCTVCHGADHTVRGVIDINSDITDSVDRQRTAALSSTGAFFALVTIVGFMMSGFIRRQFIRPLREIGAACEAVTDGNFERRSTVRNHDELGVLSDTVNSMIQGLYERFVLSRFVSSSTIASIGESEESRNENLTFLFSDVRGFTSFTERNEPETVVSTLNALLGDQTEIIQRLGGDIDKYVGDEIVAVFRGEDGIRAAGRAAVEIQQMIEAADPGRYSGQHVGIGINYGSVIVGSIGSAQRADFTAIGDNVNVAARLCSGAGRGEIIVRDNVAEAIRADGAQLDGPYRMQVKGKQSALRVYKLTGYDAPQEEA